MILWFKKEVSVETEEQKFERKYQEDYKILFNRTKKFQRWVDSPAWGFGLSLEYFIDCVDGKEWKLSTKIRAIEEYKAYLDDLKEKYNKRMAEKAFLYDKFKDSLPKRIEE
jgi:hypothetical protein